MNDPATTGKRPDFILLMIVLMLVAFGTAMIYSSSSVIAQEKYHDGYYFLKKQFFFVVIGLIVMLVLSRVPYEHLKKIAYPGVMVSFVLLILIIIPHVGVKVGGAKRWLRLGFFSFQVTELVKVSFIIFLAYFVTKKNTYIREFKRGLAVPVGVTAVVLGLILLEPDFGTAVIVAALLMSMLYLAGGRILHLSGPWWGLSSRSEYF